MYNINWKLILLGLLVVAIITLIVLAVLGRTHGFGLQGFQNPAPGGNTFTMYYADWCPHCQTIKPAFTEFVNQGDIQVGSTSCKVRMIDAAKNPEEAKGKPVKGFPTFLLETVDGGIVEYQGERKVDGFLQFINEKLGAKDSTA
jgi:thiol-disulfide isomerase/thioredoxin